MNARRRAALATSIAAAAAALLALAGAPSRSGASTVTLLTQGEMVDQADTIFHGTCVSKRSFWNDDRTAIITEYSFRAEEVLKGGDQATPGSVVFRQWGGVVGDRGYFVSGAARFSLDEEVVAFLAPPTGPSRCAYTIGLAQGKYRVEADGATGEKVLRRDLSGLRILAPAARKFVPATALEEERPKLREFLVAVREQLGK